MNHVQTAIKELSDRMGPPKARAAFGSWTASAWIVRGLIEKGHGVSASVRRVLEDTGMGNNPTAFGSLRAATYKILNAEWPAEFSNQEAKKITDEEKGFE